VKPHGRRNRGRVRCAAEAQSARNQRDREPSSGPDSARYYRPRPSRNPGKLRITRCGMKFEQSVVRRKCLGAGQKGSFHRTSPISISALVTDGSFYAKFFRNYGQVYHNAGGGYHILVGQMERITVISGSLCSLGSEPWQYGSRRLGDAVSRWLQILLYFVEFARTGTH